MSSLELGVWLLSSGAVSWACLFSSERRPREVYLPRKWSEKALSVAAALAVGVLVPLCELRTSRHLKVQEAIARINPILRGWVGYFRHGNSSRAFGSVKHHVERKVRRFAARQRGRKGFGFERWSRAITGNGASTETTGSTDVARKRAEVERKASPRWMTPPRRAGCGKPGSTWRRPKRSDGVASEAPSTERDGNSWAFLNTTAPVPDPTVELIETDFSVLGSEAG